MDYKIGEFILIKDDNYIAKKFIGEIQSKVQNDYRLYVYIFPEDTIDGRKPYMRSNEVFLTTTQTLYYLSGIDEQKVEVVSMDKYINKKYINNEKLDIPLYFFRQTYIIEENKFIPEILPLICYCQEILNPDIPFKRCACGNIFHPDCLLQSKSSKCWSDNCDYNCDSLLSEAEQYQKARIISGKSKEGNIVEELENIYNNEIEMLREKAIQEEKEEENHHVIEIQSDSSDSSDSENEKKDNKNDEINVLENKERMRLFKELEKNDNFVRERSRILIFDIFKRCLIIIKNDLAFLKKYKKYEKNKFYKFIGKKSFSKAKHYLKNLSIYVENYIHENHILFLTFYSEIFNQLLEINRNNYDFLIKVIFEEYKLYEFKDYQNKEKDEKEIKELEKEIENKINLSDDKKIESSEIEINLDNIEKLIINQKSDGSWEANEVNMKYLNIGYKDLDEFKNKNKKTLDECFEEVKLKEINDDLLITIFIACILAKCGLDKEEIKSSFEKAIENIKNNLIIFNKEFIKGNIDKLFINKINIK